MKKNLLFSLSFIGTVGIVTATPAVTLGLLGRWLDRRYDTSPKFLITLMLIALALSLLMLVKIAKSATRRFEEINKKG